ncbi:MAG: hypothetical protein N2746_00700 [Deltaproteobacteria bacterium]|nr:hypothetical protein [Deltaproteobacteria bacterium]
MNNFSIKDFYVVGHSKGGLYPSGFAKVAITRNVPIVPMVSVGGHETLFILYRGEFLAKKLRIERLIRSRAFPISIALPWIISIGPVSHLPLPAKCQIEILQPFLPGDVISVSMSSHEKTERVYNETVCRLQQKMNEYKTRRRLPIVG